eukprot:2643311-Lingulodinium_polyedra.AAC.1
MANRWYSLRRYRYTLWKHANTSLRTSERKVTWPRTVSSSQPATRRLRRRPRRPFRTRPNRASVGRVASSWPSRQQPRETPPP